MIRERQRLAAVRCGAAFFAVAVLSTIASLSLAAERTTTAIGFAKTDITPDFPVRLNGYGGRTEECEQVAARLHVRAMAIGTEDADKGPALILSVENIGRQKEVETLLVEPRFWWVARLELPVSQSAGLKPMVSKPPARVFRLTSSASTTPISDAYSLAVNDSLKLVAFPSLMRKVASAVRQ